MTSRELRIGNLVNDYQFKKPINVSIGVLEEMENGMNFYEPIPITDEWLKKFDWKHGFVKGMLIRHGNSILLLGQDINIKYVHQLQNIHFALTGTELKIK